MVVTKQFMSWSLFLQACKQQVEKMANHIKPAKLLLYSHFEFFFDESKRVVVEVDSLAVEGWRVNKRNNSCEVCMVHLCSNTQYNHVLGDLYS